MNKYFIELAKENFYATPEDIRSFFMLGMGDKAFFDTVPDKKDIVSEYGTEYNTIHITGMMLREPSWITDMGFGTSTVEVIAGIQATLREGKKVKLIMNTGGGLVSGTSNLSDIIFENRENIEVYATGCVASAGIWVYSAAGTRYAESTTVMGSIGVVTSVFDDEEYWKSYGIIWKEIVSNNAKNKRPDIKTVAGENEIKRYLTSLETVFLEAVSKHFNMSRDDVISKFHEGGLITGTEALEMNLIESLTSYDLSVATMPSELSAEKIANSTNGDGVMITQEQLDAVQGQLDDANASVTALTAEKTTLEGSLADANDKVALVTSDLENANAKLAGMGDIVGMAFEHNVNKATALNMVEAGDKASAALVALDSKSTTGSTAPSADIDEGVEADNKAEADETEAAIAYAKKLSVNNK